MKTFKQLNEVAPGTVMIVDSLNLAFRFAHKKQLFFIDEYIETIESLKRSYKASQVVILSDWGSSTYRKEVYPDYKLNRKEKQALQTPEEAAYFEKFFEEYIRVVEHYQASHYPTFRFKGVEADDIAAHIVANRAAYNFEKVVLVSSDRDWDLLINPDTMRFSYVTRKEVSYDNWHEHYEVSPEEYISAKCLIGDTGDNVPGVNKIGPKTAVKLIQQYGSALDIAASLPLPGKYVYIKNLNEFGKENLIRNYQLMDLVTFCDDAIGLENIKEIKNVFSV